MTSLKHPTQNLGAADIAPSAAQFVHISDTHEAQDSDG